LLFNLITIIL